MCKSTDVSTKRRRTSIEFTNIIPHDIDTSCMFPDSNCPLHEHAVANTSNDLFESWSVGSYGDVGETQSNTMFTDSEFFDSWSVGSVGDEADTQTNDTFSFETAHRNILDDYNVFPNIIGTGNYGDVRECEHRRTGQIFAVKTIAKAKVERLDHLEREVSLLREVNHPSIMKMVESYEDSEYVHIVTEKYSGGEVFDKIVENTTDSGCLPESEASGIIKSLLEAVDYLHERDIVHRDIKPENMLFESNAEDAAVRLIDFGLSRKHEKGDLPMSHHVGTAYYTSPETIKGNGYDRACDLWSVGVVAYILLSGNPPFNGATDADIYNAIRMGHFEFHPQVWDNVSDDAKDFILCLLRRNPRKRLSAEKALRHPWIVEHSLRRPRNVSF